MSGSERSAYMNYSGDETMGGWVDSYGSDCSVRNLVFGVLILTMLYYIVYNPKEGMWAPVKEGMWAPVKEGMWAPVKEGMWAPVKEGMWAPVKEGMYDQSYHMSPADQYTSPYTGYSGYGQNFGPPSV
jgi:hypothetical protein